MPETSCSPHLSPRTEATIFSRLIMSKVTQRTREAYSADLRDFAEFLGSAYYRPSSPNHRSGQPLATIRYRPYSAYLEYLKQTVRPKTNQPNSTATIACRIAILRELATDLRRVVRPTRKNDAIHDRAKVISRTIADKPTEMVTLVHNMLWHLSKTTTNSSKF